MAEDKKNLIPYQKAVRVGNFKLWRSKSVIAYMPSDEERAKVREESKGKMKAVGKKVDIDVLNISNLDGSWKTQIPSTMTMYATICAGFATTDPEQRDNFLGMIFTNIYNISTCSSEALHDAFFFLSEIMAYPLMLLPEKEMVKQMRAGFKETKIEKKNAEEHIGKMVEYRKKLYELIDQKKARFIEEYLRQQAERRAKEAEALKQLEQDELAEQAMDILDKKEEN